jgi:NADH:ubiquinone oxidoreductase subunit 6 (subunit J)
VAALVMFYVLSGLTLASALYVVISRNLFHAGIALIMCFVGVAGIYVTLATPFMAAMQILIYAGAIAVVLLFGFMLTHDLMRPQIQSYQRMAGFLTALGLGLVLTVTAVLSPWFTLSSAAPENAIPLLAHGYMTTFAVPFQMIALLLLIALIGAVVVARKEEGPP